MPLGFERLNERTTRPNSLINFIKPLPGPTAAIAEVILSRVAAVCYPFMKANMILVQALEEFPHNNEFIGRNFNAGEVIQLVIRNSQGQWLPERAVMMVMVHELAHCKQMNHSKAFWKVRDAYAVSLRELWGKGYTGEGLWGRGKQLATGELHAESVEVGDVPEHLCGGTYGRRTKRRRGGKEKEVVSYAERKQRRILKKFGAGGLALGADDETKVKLESGVAKKGKPRVAGSARGRDLRAAAALARFEPVKVESKVKEEKSDSESDDEYEEIGDKDGALDIDGSKLIDNNGNALVKICEDEDDKDGNAQREMDELQGFQISKSTVRKAHFTIKTAESNSRSTLQPHKKPAIKIKLAAPAIPSSNSTGTANVLRLNEIHKRRPEPVPKNPLVARALSTSAYGKDCAVCSLVNNSGAICCMACSNVLTPGLMPNHWKCESEACKDSKYINAGDVGLCGLCAIPKPSR
jgi:hypothetical protein